jgi:hypothetical protein
MRLSRLDDPEIKNEMEKTAELKALSQYHRSNGWKAYATSEVSNIWLGRPV